MSYKKARRPPETIPTQWHMLMLYPDSGDYDFAEILATLKQSDIEFVGVCHDQDVYKTDVPPTTDEAGNEVDPGHKAGDFKKAHHHILLYTPAKMTGKAIAEGLGIDVRWCKNADGLSYCLYLLHIGQLGKKEYPYTALYGTERLTERAVRRCVNAKRGVTGGVGESETEVYQLFTEWLDTRTNVSRRDVLDWATACDCLGHVLQNYSAFWSIAQEHSYRWADVLGSAEIQRIEKKVTGQEKRIDSAVKRCEMYARLMEMKYKEN